MFVKFVDIACFFLCKSYPCVLFESLSHVINQESHFYFTILFVKLGEKLPCSFFEIYPKFSS